jgi:hypothetical protein
LFPPAKKLSSIRCWTGNKLMQRLWVYRLLV